MKRREILKISLKVAAIITGLQVLHVADVLIFVNYFMIDLVTDDYRYARAKDFVHVGLWIIVFLMLTIATISRLVNVAIKGTTLLKLVAWSGLFMVVSEFPIYHCGAWGYHFEGFWEHFHFH